MAPMAVLASGINYTEAPPERKKSIDRRSERRRRSNSTAMERVGLLETDPSQKIWYKLHGLAVILSKLPKEKVEQWTQERQVGVMETPKKGEQSRGSPALTALKRRITIGNMLDKISEKRALEARRTSDHNSPTLNNILKVNQVEQLRPIIWTLFSEPESSSFAFGLSMTILIFIVISSTTFCLESMEQFENDSATRIFLLLEYLCISVFTLEYLIKLWAAPERPAFVKNFMNLIDLAAILPFYFELAAASSDVDTRILRVLRLARVFRVFKLGGRFSKMQVVVTAVIDSMDMLGMLGFLLLLSMIFFSTLMYFCESGNALEGEEDHFRSIPASFWWCIVTLMTVGYGDAVPRSDFGRMVASLTMLASVIILALPISVIGANFTHHWMIYKDQLKLKELSGKLKCNLVELSSNIKLQLQVMDDLLREIEAIELKLTNIIATIRNKLAARSRKNMNPGASPSTSFRKGNQIPLSPLVGGKGQNGPGKDAESAEEGEDDDGLQKYFMCAQLLREMLEERISQIQLISSDEYLHLLSQAMKLQKKASRKAEEGSLMGKQVSEVEQEVEEMQQLFHLSITGQLAQSTYGAPPGMLSPTRLSPTGAAQGMPVTPKKD
mmetsp:Transcript_12093/g.25410  ORF Transcript_12093/g.25410 Transcript_12093/m.25410 type:complete len:612 (-) Transcript_12093:217-2052(-)